MTKTIAIVQNGPAIYGIGATLDAAIADAREWLDDDGDLDDLPSHSRTDGEMFWSYCTPALARRVQEVGGDIAWRELNDGTLCLSSEEG